ncbi:ribosome biogenesis GTP-binding protein YihA/YsxC [Mesomycoplasma lagogenitalium]|uniref:Probable GTP-binding protein EngB n=1 Tax=Mesomycoplasma lagogenitalium TaxID=171286 RepID=A0ABY8LSR8_9BACT|nr:ribosome biogenesis GTP-binding protein YihA/YsxC [Mesomycoplasma lagogenitalium]WGI36299.1 ribosome biogenesis GTP-binding protein YihA/YsxC [Mesomycoplasma lagogenitalium]
MWKFIVSSSGKSNWLNHNEIEICFIGRSNVGKSSLINALANQKIAKTSNTPGRTQLINFFKNSNNKIIVDLPGYGYAKMSKTNAQKMFDMIEQYFTERENLKYVFLLFDSRLGLLENDLQMIEFLQSLNHNVILVGTKADKLNQAQMHKIKKQLEKFNNLQFSYFVSSLKNKNINLLNQQIDKIFSDNENKI